MTLDLSIPEEQPIALLKPKITVIGVGGAGGNAVNNMIQSNLEGVDFVAANTDAQALMASLAPRKIQLGLKTTQGQGAGARPEVGRESAEEAEAELSAALEGSHMVFITAGMGGGTGTGAGPYVAKLAREKDILTVGVVTKPFTFEGRHRMALADEGIEELSKYVDTLIVIPNQNLFNIATEQLTFADAFKKADQVLQDGVRSITDLITTQGIINLDFSDIRTVMTEMGRAMMGTGMSSDPEHRAIEAAQAAISNPLLDNDSMEGAKGILINIAGGADLTLFEVDEAANRVRQEVDPEANIIFGASFDASLEGSIRVSVVATGITNRPDMIPTFVDGNSPAVFKPKKENVSIQVPKAQPIVKPVEQQYVEEKRKPEPEKVEIPSLTMPAIEQPVAQKAEEPIPFNLSTSPAPQASQDWAMPNAWDYFNKEPKPQQKTNEDTFKSSFAAPTFEQRNPEPIAQPQQDLFVAPAPQPMQAPAPKKEEVKPRKSLFSIITERKQVSDPVEPTLPDDSNLPDFLRHS